MRKQEKIKVDATFEIFNCHAAVPSDQYIQSLTFTSLHLVKDAHIYFLLPIMAMKCNKTDFHLQFV